jgi:hypothetical protein
MALYRRTARLRPEYADWYPLVEADRWHDAALLTEVVRRQLVEGSPAWAAEARVLAEAHFEFRGGGNDRRSGERRRPAQG